MDNLKKESQSQIKWYLRPIAVIIAILCVGPFALPLVWISPAFKKSYKIFITILVIILTIWFIKASVELCEILLKRIQEFNDALK